MARRELSWIPLAAALLASCILPDDFHSTDGTTVSGATNGAGSGGRSSKSSASSTATSGEAPAGAAGHAGCEDDADCVDDDGRCDGVDRCVEGQCEEGEPPVCVAGDACHVASCDPEEGCTNQRIGASDDLTDEDGDGYPACVDCDDDDDEVHPEAEESIGDGIDQNCDGRELCYEDLDGDGARGVNSVESDDVSCGNPGEALEMAPEDCDDMQACVRPGQLEFCNAVDDDCDGRIDETCRPLLSAGSHHTCALRPDGSVECWGDREYGEPSMAMDTFSTLSTGTGAACAVSQALEAECWGGPDAADFLEAPLGLFTAVSAGEFHACGLRPYRTIECWGEDGLGQSTAPEGFFDAVSVGRLISCGLGDDGAVRCWGDELTNATGTYEGPFVNVSAGAEHVCAVREDGGVECWGLNDVGQAQPPSGEFLTVSAGRYHSCGLQTDLSVTCWGEDSAGEATALEGPFIAVSVGHVHSCGLRANGDIECWGSNLDGQSEVPSSGFATRGTCGPLTDPNRIGPLRVANVYLRPDCSPYCMTDEEHVTDWGIVRSFDYAIPTGNEIVDVICDGVWGYPGIANSSAPAQFFLEDVMVAQCLRGAPCWDSPDDTLISWSFSYRDQEIEAFEKLFEDGHADLSAFQTARWAVTAHDLALTVVTEPGPTAGE